MMMHQKAGQTKTIKAGLLNGKGTSTVHNQTGSGFPHLDYFC
jgi:hypothetical protein